MNALRRFSLKATAGALAWVLPFALLKPLRVLAKPWNQPGFDAKALANALNSIGATRYVESPDIEIKAPDVAENGAIVPIEVVSRIPNTRFIAILGEKNPFPLIATFEFLGDAEGFISTRIKLGESSLVRVIVRADDKVFSAAREIRVTIGGCGA
jgi:sulfur-oxidizing protein SoxY